MSMLPTTQRLRIRPIADTDFDAVFALESDPEIMRYIRDAETNPEGTRARMARWRAYAENNPGLGVFAVELQETGALAGTCTARHLNFDPQSPEMEIGYIIDKTCWGQGLASELVPALTQYLLKTSGADHVVAFTDLENHASQRVLLKNGFVIAGERADLYDTPSLEFVFFS